MNKNFRHVAPHTIVALSPDTALSDGLWWLKSAGDAADSRNGRVIVAPGPVITAYPRPRQRVMMSPVRDANPFFHLFEALWMLAGRNDVAKIAVFAKQMEAFAEDGLQWGAYGYRWRHFFGFDQLKEVLRMLTADPMTRRAVLTMWAPDGDLVGPQGGPQSKDIPCNTQVYFDATRGMLNMTVTNRSNDIVWGAYGANLVHMSMLHEFVSAATDIPLGTYYQFSNNYHLYPDRPDVQRLIIAPGSYSREWEVRFSPPTCIYQDLGVEPFPIVNVEWERWLDECEAFVLDPLANVVYLDPFFTHVAAPMVAAHVAYRHGDFEQARAHLRHCVARDWRQAAHEWLDRREAKRQEAA